MKSPTGSSKQYKDQIPGRRAIKEGQCKLGIISIYPREDPVFLNEDMCLMSSVCSQEPVTACQSPHLLLICRLSHTVGKEDSQIADRQTGRQ